MENGAFAVAAVQGVCRDQGIPRVKPVQVAASLGARSPADRRYGPGDSWSTTYASGPHWHPVAGHAAGVGPGPGVRPVPAVAAGRHLAADLHRAAGPGRHQGPDHLGHQRRLRHRPCPASTLPGHGRGGLQTEPPGGVATEPADHGLGRSRVGLTTKLHSTPAADELQQVGSDSLPVADGRPVGAAVQF